MPTGFGGSDLNQLKGKDDIEDDSVYEPVNLVKTCSPHHPSDPSNAPFIPEELQFLPENHRQKAFGLSKSVTKIFPPVDKTRRSALDHGPRPGNYLYTRNQGNASPRKRGLAGSAAQPSSEYNRPRKQPKVEQAMAPLSVNTDDEEGDDMDQSYGHRNKTTQCQEKRNQKSGSQEAMSQPINTSKFFDSSRLHQMDMNPEQRKTSRNGVTAMTRKPIERKTIGRADSQFLKDVEEIDVQPNVPMLSTHGSGRQNDCSRWNSSEDIAPTKWSNNGNKKKQITTPQYQGQKPAFSDTKFNLVCFQCGINSYDGKDSLGLFIRVEPRKRLTASYEDKGKEKEIWSLDLKDISSINSVHVNTLGRIFAIQLGRRRGEESARHVLFTLRDSEDIDKFKTKFFHEGVGNMPTEQDVKYFDKLTNNLNDWKTRSDCKKSHLQLLEEPMVIGQQDNRQEKKKKQGFTVEIAVRRSARNKVSRGDKAEKIPLKRSRSFSADEFGDLSRETRSSKIPKLELPKPRWKTSLVYPPTGPKREIVDYDDLSRLNSNQFLNDNIVNFYLRYIEVQLQQRNPELAKETYFLNTFFYERLTKKDEKGKREIDSVLKWTAKVDIFKTSYIVVPINESSHWYLAIICNLCNLERKMKDKVPSSPENKSIDLESSGTLAEAKENGHETPSGGASDAGAVAESELTSIPHDGTEHDVEIIETRASLELMALDEEWPKEVENLESYSDRKPTGSNRTEVIELDDSSSQILKPKAKGKSKAKEKLLQKKKNIAPDTPAIIILDSMGFGTSPHSTTFKNLREYLAAEALLKRNLEITKEDIDAAYAKVPGQNNWYDCGLFLLHYVERFLNKPREFVAMFLARENRAQDQELWRKEEIKDMREKLFHLFTKLHEEQEAVEIEREDSKKQEKVLVGARKLSSEEGPVESVMAIEGSAKDQGVQKVSEPTAASKGTGFEKFTAEFDDFITFGGSNRGGEDDASKNPTRQITHGAEAQPINVEGLSSSMLQYKEVTLLVRESQ